MPGMALCLLNLICAEIGLTGCRLFPRSPKSIWAGKIPHYTSRMDSNVGCRICPECELQTDYWATSWFDCINRFHMRPCTLCPLKVPQSYQEPFLCLNRSWWNGNHFWVRMFWNHMLNLPSSVPMGTTVAWTTHEHILFRCVSTFSHAR